PGDGHVELLGDDLSERRADAGSEIDLAGEDTDGAIGGDGEPRVELVRRQAAGVRQRRPALQPLGEHARDRLEQVEPDDEGARLEQVPAGKKMCWHRGRAHYAPARITSVQRFG